MRITLGQGTRIHDVMTTFKGIHGAEKAAQLDLLVFLGANSIAMQTNVEAASKGAPQASIVLARNASAMINGIIEMAALLHISKIDYVTALSALCKDISRDDRHADSDTQQG